MIWLALLNAVYGAFLVPLRIGATHLPVALLLASAGNYGVGLAGGRVLRRPAGAAIPGLLWLVVAFLLGTSRREGDLVIPGDWVGVAFLVVGAVASAVAFGRAPGRAGPRRENGASPHAPSGR